MTRKRNGRPCAAKTTDGRPCSGWATRTSDFCFWHDPERRAQVAAAGERGGRSSAQRSDGATAHQVLSLEELGEAPRTRAEALAALGRISHLTLTGRLDHRRSQAAAMALTRAIAVMPADPPNRNANELCDAELVEAMIYHVSKGFGLTLEEGRAALERAKTEKLVASAETSTPVGGNGCKPAPHLFVVEVTSPGD